MKKVFFNLAAATWLDRRFSLEEHLTRTEWENVYGGKASPDKEAIMGKVFLLIPAAFFLQALSPAIPGVKAAAPPPKLILQITVDGLRGDMPGRYLDRLGDGGFRRLLENGVVYSNAHYRHSNTETIVGHTVLATGANPAASGMVANVWFDRETGALTYNIEDGSCELLGAGAGVNKETEIDPTQKVAKVTGRSAAAR